MAFNSHVYAGKDRLENPPIVWTIAGSDSGGGAGIQADLLTMHDLSCHGCSVITTLTAQNSVNVSLVETVSESMLLAQLNSLLADLPPVAIKIGLLASQVQLNTLAQWLAQVQPSVNLFVVLDPVMMASSGDRFSDQLLDFSPFAGLISVLTPNQHELTLLCQSMPVMSELSATELCGSNRAEYNMIIAAKWLSDKFSCHVIAKGGDAMWQQQAFDIYVSRIVKGASVEHNHQIFRLSSPRVNTINNHGCGCTLSSAIVCFIAHDFVVHDAVVLAKAYVTNGLKQSVTLGGGPGVLTRTGWPSDLTLMPYISIINPSDLPQNMVTESSSFVFKSVGRSLGVYPVLDDINTLIQVLKAGCKTVQYRAKLGNKACYDEQQLEVNIINAIQLGRDFNAQLFINDHWQLALKHRAFGVHLGQEDTAGADLRAIADAGLALGISSHSYFEALLAHQFSPSYIALGHIFPTTTKQMPSKPQGINKLRRYVSLFGAHYPTVAIGGIDRDRLEVIAATGVGDVAVVRAVTQAENPADAYQSLQLTWLGFTKKLQQSQQIDYQHNKWQQVDCKEVIE